MANFDHYNFDIRSVQGENRWRSQIPERRDVDAPVRKSIFDNPVVRIVAIVLLVALALGCIYTIVVHPIYRLQLRLASAKYFEIKVDSVYSYWQFSFYISGTDHATIQVYADQNAFAIINESNVPERYYKIIDGVLHEYNDLTKDWEKAEDEKQEDSSFYAGIFDRHNYKYSINKLFAWQYKDSDLYFKSSFGKFKFIHETGINETTMTFKHFDWDRHTPPWEESE